MENREKDTKNVAEQTHTVAEKPKYNKTWQALIDKPIGMVVYDKTLFYR